MLVKYYNGWTTHEDYFEFPKEIKKKERLEHFKKWLIKDAEIGSLSDNDNDIEYYNKELNDLFDSGEMTIIKPQKIK